MAVLKKADIQRRRSITHSGLSSGFRCDAHEWRLWHVTMPPCRAVNPDGSKRYAVRAA